LAQQTKREKWTITHLHPNNTGWPKQWDQKNKRLKSSAPNSNQINGIIDRIKNDVQQRFLDFCSRGKLTTAKELKQLYLGVDEKTKHKTLMDAFEYHNIKMAEKVEAGQTSRKTLLRYQSTQKKLVKFMKREYRTEDKPLKELRLAFITEFDHYLITVEKLQTNTAHKAIKVVKRVMNIAVTLDWIPSNPFNQFKCTYKNPERIVLTESELEALRLKKLSIPRLDKVRDIFLFQCYTGFAYTDIYNFKRNAVTIGIDGEYWLTTYRQKTNTKENVPLLPIALDIIDKYKDDPECIDKDKLLPINSNQRYNSYLKELADICGIKKKVTTHIARHTFATTVTLSNGVPIETVSKMLGHTRLATTQIYARVLEKKVSEDMQQLKAKLHSKSEPSASNSELKNLG
jgi:site-specific recombinase XerD